MKSRRIISLILSMLMVLSLMPTNISFAETDISQIFARGDGETEDTAFIINTAEQLAAFRDSVNAGETYENMFIALGEDIDLEGSEANQWTPIGASDKPFAGTFDGRKHEISGLYINATSEGMYGLFGFVSSTGTIKRLGVAGSITHAEEYAGGIAAKSSGTIENCYNKADIHTNGYAGGIVGWLTANGKIESSYNAGHIEATGSSPCAGGLVGYAYNGPSFGTKIIANSYNVGTVTSQKATTWGHAGGLIGCGYDTNITNCYNAGTIIGQTGYNVGTIGSLIGDTFDSMSGIAATGAYYLKNCTNGTEKFVIGEALTAEQMKSAESFEGWDFDEVWEMKGEPGKSRPTLKNSPEKSDVYVITTKDELVELFNKLGTNEYTYEGKTIKLGADIDLTGTDWTARSIYGATFDGDGHTITGLSATSGLFNLARETVIKNLGVVGEVNGDTCGGIAAVAKGKLLIENCYSAVNVTGKIGAGGILGYAQGVDDETFNVEIKNCYNIGNVSGNKADTQVGGVVGIVSYNGSESSSLTVTNCYNAGSVSSISAEAVYPIVCEGSYSTAVDCYYLDTCGSTKAGGKALTAEQMKEAASFENWDFSKVWNVNDIFAGRPTLKKTPEKAEIGTESNPYTISTYDELVAFNESINDKNNSYDYDGKYIKLTADISVPEDDTWSSDEGTFRGTFDGDGHYIGTLKSSKFNSGETGFFGLADGATIKNLDLQVVFKCDSLHSTCAVGGIVGNGGIGTVIENCSVSGSISAGGGYSYNNGGIGGIMGSVSGGVIRNCINYADILANNRLDDGAGGILGNDRGYSIIERCVNEGDIIKPKQDNGQYQLSKNNAGGIVGGGERTKIRNCYNLGDITGGYNLGGIAGYINESESAETGEILNCYNYGTITAITSTTSDVGAIYGNDMKYTPVTNCYYLTVEGCELPDYSRDATGKTAEQFSSGEVAWLLQDAQPKDETGEAPLIWGQIVTAETGYAKSSVPTVFTDEKYRVRKVTFVKKNTDPNAEELYVEHDAKYTNDGCKLTSMPSEPTSEIYTFKNWVYYDDPENIFDESKAVNADVDVLAIGNEISTNPNDPPSDVIEIKKNTYLVNTPQQVVLSQYVANKSGAAVNMDNVEFRVNSESALPPGMQLSTPPLLVTGQPNKVGTYTVVFDIINKGVAPMSVNPEGTQLTLTFKIGLEGDGTEASPYLINDVNELVYFRDNVNSGGVYGNSGVHVKLAINDFDLSRVCSSTLGSWEPIGTASNTFKGVFDGNGQYINNLYIDSEGNNQGLFGYNEGTIKKLNVSGEVKGLGTSGGIAAENSGTIEMCTNACSVSISRNSDYVGGIAGKNYTEGIIKNCYNVGAVTGTGENDRIGGIVGDNDGKIENCYNIGAVTGTQSDAAVGGIAGVNWATTGIKNCYYLSTEASGGIAGSDIEGKAEGKTEKQFESGEVTWLLQNGQPKVTTGDAPLVWGQIAINGTGYYHADEPGLMYNVTNNIEKYRVRKVTFVKLNTDPNAEEEYVEHDAKYTNNGYALPTMPSEPTSTNYTFKNWVYYDDPEIIFYEITAVNADVDVLALGNEITTESENPPSDVINISKNKDMTPVDLTAYVANKSGASAKMFEFELADEELPEGVTLGLDKKTISGKPTATVGAYTVAFNVTNKGVAPMSLNPEGTQLKITFEVGLEGDGTEEKPYLINDATELVYFRDNVNSGGDYGKGVSHVKLMSGINLSTVCSDTLGSWEPIGDDSHPFCGTFDGNEKLISNLYIIGTSSNRGLFGRNDGTIKKLSVSGKVRGATLIGGIVGKNYGNIEMCANGCYVEAVDMAGKAGGIAGENTTGGRIENCYNAGDVKVINVAAYVGGVTGFNYGEIASCYSYGKVEGTQDSANVGGVAGMNYTANTATITNCYYHAGRASGGICGSDVEGKAEGKAGEQFESGEVAWLLQNGQPIDAATGAAPLVWGQKLVNTSSSEVSNNDIIPIFTKDSAKKVYSVEFWSNNEAVGDYALYNNNVKYANVGDDVPLASHTSEIFRGWAESIGADTVLSSYTFSGNADVKLYAAWKGKVMFSNPASTSQSYTAGTPKTITPAVLVDGVAATALSASDFVVKYYELNENVGAHGELKSMTPVTNAISAGKYLCVIDFARDELKNDYYIKPKFEVTNSTPAVLADDILTAYDNVRFMYIKSGNEAAQKPIYFEKQTVNVTMTDSVVNRLVNPNASRVEYESSNTSVASVDAATGAVTINGAGSAVIMATSIMDNAADVYASYTLNVTKKVITVTAKDKTIKYGEAFVSDGYELSESVVLDDTNVSYTTDYRDNDGIGKYEIRVSGLASDIYDIEYKSGRLTVEAKPLSLGSDIEVSVAPKSYDGNATATVNANVAAGSLVSGDKVTVLASGSYDSENAGITTVNYEIEGLSGRDSSNYILTGTMTGMVSATIEQAEVTFSAPAVTTHVYDTYAKSVSVLAYANGTYFDEFETVYRIENAAAPLSELPTDVGVYDVSVNILNRNYKAKNAFGVKLTIKSAQQDFFSIEGIGDTVTYGEVLPLETAGTDGDVSYSIKSGSEYATLTETISDLTSKPITKLTATGVGTVTLEAVSKKANYADKKATRTFVIRPKTIDVSAAVPDSKTYDGTTSIDGVVLTAADVIIGDAVKIAMDSATVGTPDVENNKTVFVNGLRIESVNGSSAESEMSKYQLSATALQSKINITKAPVTAVAIEAASKVYDGTTNAEYTVKGLTGVVSGDEDFVSVTGTAAFDSKNVNEATKVTLSSMKLTGTKSGNYTLTATSAEDSTARIQKANVSFSLGTLSYVYDKKQKTVSVTATVDGKPFDDYDVRYSGNATDVGNYDVIISLRDTQNFATSYTPQQLEIVKADQSAMTITGLVGTPEYGKTFKLTVVGGESSIATKWSSSAPSSVTVDSDGNVTIGNITGNAVTITATKQANGNYEEQSTSVTFTPVKKSASITVRNLNQVYDGAPKPVEVVSAATTSVKYFDEAGQPIVGVPVNAGTYYVEVTATGNYEGEQSAVLTIKKAVLDTSGMVFDIADENNDGKIIYGESYSIADTYSGNAADKTITFTGTGIYGETSVKPTNAGSYTAILTISKDNHESKSMSIPFVIEKAVLTAKPADSSRAYGENNPEFTIGYTGFKYTDTESSILIKPTASTVAHSSSPVNTYPIVATGGYADNYKFDYEEGTLTVVKATGGNFHIIGGNASPYVGNEFTLTAYYNNDVPTVSWATSDAAIATVDENTGKVTIKDVGEATITAYMTDSRFDNNLSVSFKLKASRLPETQNLIVFAEPFVEKYMKDDDFTITASNASQGATVKYTSSDATIAAVDEDTGKVTVKKAGMVVITAKAVKAYCPDVTASYTLTVKKIPMTITAADKTLTYGDTFDATTLEYSSDNWSEDEFGGTLGFVTRYTNTSRVGDYDVTPTGITSDIYDITFAPGTITVEPKPLTKDDFVVVPDSEKTYDGTTAIGISASVKSEKVVGTDNLFVNITGAFADANASEELKDVNASIVSISGKGFENYVLSGSMDVLAKAKINPCEVKFFASAETVKNYDGQVHRIDISAMANGNVYGSENYTVYYKAAGMEKTTAPKDVGEYAVSVELDSTQTNYVINTQPSAVLKIEQNTNVELTVQGSMKNVTVGDMFTLYAQYGNDVAEVTWSSNKPECVSIDPDTGEVEVLKATDGIVTITATMKDTNYGGLSKDFDMIVSKKEIKLSAAESLVREYNGDVQKVTYKSGTLDLSDVTVNTSYTLINDSTVTEAKNVGTYLVTYEIDDERYTGSGEMTLYINKATVKVYANAISKEYGEQYDKDDYELAVSNNVKGIDAEALYDYVSFSSEGAASGANVGAYDIAVTLTKENDANCDYVVDTAANGKLTVTPATLTVKIDDVTREHGEANPTELVYTIEGFKNNENAEILTGGIVPKYAETITDTVGTQTDVITAESTLANSNYTIDVVYNEGAGADLIITKIAVGVSAGVSRVTYLTIKLDKPMENLTASNFEVKNGETPVTITEATPSSDNKTYTLKGTFATTTTYTVTMNIVSDTHELVGLPLSIKPSGSGGSGGSGGGGGGGGSAAPTTYTVSFETNGGSEISGIKVEKNDTAAMPKAPTKEGYTFGGWYTDKALTVPYDFDSKVIKTITLYAKWIENEPQKPGEGDDDNNNDDNKPTLWKNPFSDVKENDWFYESVKYASENGLMSGTSATEFAPDETLTRGMLVTVLYRAAGEPAAEGGAVFGDVNADSYYAKAVSWAQQNGIVSGVSENEFEPEENITREQIATIMFRYAKHMSYDVSVGESTNILSYTDYDEISEYAIEAMQYAVGSGLIRGKSESTLNPTDTATRAEIAVILNRFIEGNK